MLRVLHIHAESCASKYPGCLLNVALQRHFDILQHHFDILQRHIDKWQRHMTLQAAIVISHFLQVWFCTLLQRSSPKVNQRNVSI